MCACVHVCVHACVRARVRACVRACVYVLSGNVLPWLGASAAHRTQYVP